MPLLYHAYVYLEFLILACTIYILAPQQVDIYFNFIGNFVLPLSEDEVEVLQSEEARRAEEIAERKRKSSKKSTQKRNQKRAEIKAKAEAGDPEAMAEYKAILEKGRQNNRKRSEKCEN